MNTKLLSFPLRVRLDGGALLVFASIASTGADLFQYCRSRSEIPPFVLGFALIVHVFASAKFCRAWHDPVHNLTESVVRWLEMIGSLVVAVFLVWMLGVV